MAWCVSALYTASHEREQMRIFLTLFFIGAVVFCSGDVMSESQVNIGSSCAVMADAALQNGDRFGGEVGYLKDSGPGGAWYHQTPKGDNFYMDKVDWIMAPASGGPDKPSEGVSYYKFGGTGTWNRMEGYSFRVLAEKRDKDSEYYSITIFNPQGECMYTTSGYVTSGKVQRMGAHCPELDTDF